MTPVCSDVPKDLPLPPDKSALWCPQRGPAQAALVPATILGRQGAAPGAGCSQLCPLPAAPTVHTFLSAYSVPETWPLPAQSQGLGVEEGESRVNGQLGQCDFTTPPSPATHPGPGHPHCSQVPATSSPGSCHTMSPDPHLSLPKPRRWLPVAPGIKSHVVPHAPWPLPSPAAPTLGVLSFPTLLPPPDPCTWRPLEAPSSSRLCKAASFSSLGSWYHGLLHGRCTEPP